MPRPLRLDHPGAHFHITSRGNEQRSIFEDSRDREQFYCILTRACDRYCLKGHAHCLMGNHYHLLVESVDGRLSAGIQHLNGSYARWFNRRWNRRGHLFEGRFKANLIDRESYFLEVVRYIELNPCRAGLTTDPIDWQWSSHRSRLGIDRAPDFLCVDDVLAHFGSGLEAVVEYRKFVLAGLGDAVLRDALKNSPILGSPEFRELHSARAKSLEGRQKVPVVQKSAGRPGLEEILPDGLERHERRRQAVTAFVGHGYRMTEIARHLGIHYTTISRWLRGECDNS